MNKPQPNAALQLGRQLRQPTGPEGISTGLLMNQSNLVMYEDAINQLQLQPGHQLLEIGFGNGKFFDKYFALQPDMIVSGIDFSETMVTEATRNNQALVERQQLKLYLADSASLPFPDATFDTVLTLNTLYFWPNPVQQLQEIKRVLKPGGKLLLGYRPKYAIEKAPFTKEVFTLYNPEQVTELAKKAGFINLSETENLATVTTPDGTVITMPGKTLSAQKAP